MASMTGDPTRLRVQLLRSPQLLLPDGSAHPLSERDAALLALLALDGPATRERIAAWLWPDAGRERARTSLRQRLFRLRERAGRDVVAGADVLALAQDAAVDLGELDRLADDATALPGELLEGLHFDGDDELGAWVGAARERWRARRRERLGEAAARLESEGRIAAALAYAERLSADEPLAEHAQRRRMRLHHLRGDTAAALACYEALHAAMRRELGAEPGAETRALRELIARSVPPGAAAPRPPPLLHPPRLIGREREWALLGAAFDARRPLLVIGEPGIGKSRLLADFGRAHPGALIVAGRPGDSVVPYATLARLVRAVLDAAGGAARIELREPAREALSALATEFGSASPGTGIDALRLQHAVLALLDATRLPALALDDLHHADSASVDLAIALAAGCQGTRALLMASRGAEMPPALQALIAAEPTLDRGELAPLDETQVAALIADLGLGLDAPRWAAALHRHTRGNPLFVLETLRELLRPGTALPAPDGALPLPPRVGQLIEQRLARLPERALQLARVAALAGPDFSLELAAALIGCPLIALAEPWRELERALVLSDGAFAHDLVLEATRRTVPLPVARALHASIATHLGAADKTPPARLALHWSEAADWRRAAAAWSDAAAAAFVASQVDAAVAAHEASIDAWERAGDGVAAHGQAVHLVAALIYAAPGERALGAAHRALALARTPHQRAEALLMLAHTQVWLMQYEPCLRTSQEAVALAATLGDIELQCHAACRLAAAFAHLGRAAEALPYLDAVRDAALTRVPVGLRCQFLGELGNTQMLADDADGAERTYALLIATALGANERLLARQAAFIDAVLQWQRGRIDATERRLREAIGLRDADSPNDGMTRNETMLLGVVRAAQGCFGDAVELLEAAVEGFRERGPKARAVLAENHLARLWLALGQSARAHQALRTDPEGEADFVVCARLTAALQVAPSPAGVEALRRQLDSPTLRTAMRLLGAIELARHEDPDAALARCVAVRAEAEAKGIEGAAAHAQIALVRALLRRGDVAAAAQAAREQPIAHAIELFAPEAHWWRAQALAAAGDTAAADAALQAALDWLGAANVPTPFRDGFTHRQPVHAALRALAQRRGLAAPAIDG